MAAAAVSLIALRADLDRGWPAGARWIGGGVEGADLEQHLGSQIRFRIRGDGTRLWLRGRARVEAEGSGRRSVRLRIAVAGADGSEREVWSATQRHWRGRALPARPRIAASFDLDGEAELVLDGSGPPGTRVIWEGLGLFLPTADAGWAPRPAGGEPAASATGEREPSTPLFSVLTPVHNPPIDVLAETIASVRAQTLADWELCLVDDGSSDPAVQEALRAAATEPRIRLLRREQAGGISAATNAALEMAEGEYVALLDHDDLLLPDALEQVAAVLRERPDTDMVYSDEEVFEVGGPTHVFAKPHWSPDLLRSQMYTCHLGVYRRRLAAEVGGFRSGFDGSQDFDFALRFSERGGRVVHIPRVLYRWRAHAGSTAGSAQAKPAAYPAARRAIAEHLERTGADADVHFGPWQGIYRVVHRLPPSTTVAVGIVDPTGTSQALLDAIADGERSGVAGAVAFTAPTLAAAAERAGAADVVVLCEEPVEPLTRLWLARLAGFALQPGVAAVGARTVAPDGRVERSGSVVDAGLPAPLMFGTAAGDPGPLGVGLLPANAAIVDGVVAVAGATLRELGGLDPAHGSLAIADLCLRGIEAGMRVVSAPDVLLRRQLRPGPANDPEALAGFRSRWAAAFPRDPYFDLEVSWPGVGQPAAASG